MNFLIAILIRTNNKKTTNKYNKYNKRNEKK